MRPTCRDPNLTGSRTDPLSKVHRQSESCLEPQFPAQSEPRAPVGFGYWSCKMAFGPDPDGLTIAGDRQRQDAAGTMYFAPGGVHFCTPAAPGADRPDFISAHSVNAVSNLGLILG